MRAHIPRERTADESKPIPGDKETPPPAASPQTPLVVVKLVWMIAAILSAYVCAKFLHVIAANLGWL